MELESALLTALEEERQSHRVTRQLLFESQAQLHTQQQKYDDLWATVRECQSLSYDDDVSHRCRELETWLLEAQREAHEELAEQQQMARCSARHATEELRVAFRHQNDLLDAAQFRQARAESSEGQVRLLTVEIEMLQSKAAAAEAQSVVAQLCNKLLVSEKQGVQRELCRCTRQVQEAAQGLLAAEVSMEAAEEAIAELRTHITQLQLRGKDRPSSPISTSSRLQGRKHKNVEAQIELQRVQLERVQHEVAHCEAAQCGMESKGVVETPIASPHSVARCFDDSPYMLPSSASPRFDGEMRHLQLE